MKEKKNITTIEDIRLLVDSFYTKVRANERIGPVFDEVIKERWPEHLEKMYRFWQTVLLETHTYFGSPFPPHARLPIQQEHFDIWLRLWHETLDEYFIGDTAAEAKWRSNKMAALFLSKIEYYRGSTTTPLV